MLHLNVGYAAKLPQQKYTGDFLNQKSTYILSFQIYNFNLLYKDCMVYFFIFACTKIFLVCFLLKTRNALFLFHHIVGLDNYSANFILFFLFLCFSTRCQHRLTLFYSSLTLHPYFNNVFK